MIIFNISSCLAPVVVIFSPLGAFVSSHVHRQVLAVFIYVLETMALVGFLVTGPPMSLVLAGGIIIVVAYVQLIYAD